MCIAFVVIAAAASGSSLRRAYQNPRAYGVLGYPIVIPLVGLIGLNLLLDRGHVASPRWSVPVIWLAWTFAGLLATIYAIKWGERRGH